MGTFNGFPEITSFAQSDEVIISDKSGFPFVSRRIAMSNLSSQGISKVSTMYSSSTNTNLVTAGLIVTISNYDLVTGIGNALTGEVTIAEDGLYRAIFSSRSVATSRKATLYFKKNGVSTLIGSYGRYGEGGVVPENRIEIFTGVFNLLAGDVVSISTTILSNSTVTAEINTFDLEKY